MSHWPFLRLFITGYEPRVQGKFKTTIQISSRIHHRSQVFDKIIKVQEYTTNKKINQKDAQHQDYRLGNRISTYRYKDRHTLVQWVLRVWEQAKPLVNLKQYGSTKWNLPQSPICIEREIICFRMTELKQTSNSYGSADEQDSHIKNEIEQKSENAIQLVEKQPPKLKWK